MRKFLLADWPRNGGISLIALAALQVAGCEATALEPSPTVQGDVAAQVAVGRAGQRPTLNGLKGEFGPTVKLSGTMCSGETEVVGLGGVGSVMINSELDTLNEGGASRGACTAEIEITVPAGYQLSPSVCATVGLTAARDSARGKVRLRASFPGISSVGSLTKTIEGFDGEFVDVCGLFPQVITTGCGTAPRTYKLVVAVDMETAPETLFQLQKIDADLSYADGALFRACSSRAQLPAPSARDEGCGGPNRHACGFGLTCRRDRLTYAGTAGRCLSYADAMRPRKANELCGPDLSPACESDLICLMTGVQRGGEQVGTCTSQTANQGEECGALVGRSCRSDLICSDLGRCEDPADQRESQREGEPCADTAPACAMGLTCDADTNICRASTGAWGEGCKTVALAGDALVGCEVGLACKSAVCRNVDAPAGERCVVDVECASGDCDVAQSVCR